MSENLAQEKIIKLVSSDGKKFKVPINVIRQCGTINKFIEELRLDDEKESEVTVPLQNVSGEILEKIIQFCEYHCNDPVLTYEDLEDEPIKMSDWDAKLLDVDRTTLYHLLLAGHYLDLKKLLRFACRTVANMSRGKSVEEMRLIYNIKNDFTPEEEEKLRKENAWCEIEEKPKSKPYEFSGLALFFAFNSTYVLLRKTFNK